MGLMGVMGDDGDDGDDGIDVDGDERAMWINVE